MDKPCTRRGRVWNQKLGAYNKILEALHFAKAEAEARYENIGRDRSGESAPRYSTNQLANFDEQEKNRLKAKDEMRKLLESGTLLISSEARQYLVAATKLRYDEWMNSDELEFWDTESENLKKTIDEFDKLARKDPGLKST